LANYCSIYRNWRQTANAYRGQERSRFLKKSGAKTFIMQLRGCGLPAAFPAEKELLA
jgi:hypothetical protein